MPFQTGSPSAVAQQPIMHAMQEAGFVAVIIFIAKEQRTHVHVFPLSVLWIISSSFTKYH